LTGLILRMVDEESTRPRLAPFAGCLESFGFRTGCLNRVTGTTEGLLPRSRGTLYSIYPPIYSTIVLILPVNDLWFLKMLYYEFIY
jgi:hypothetical protein